MRSPIIKNKWNPNIPKVAHFYWHGEMLSWLRYLTLKTFQKQNPDWRLKFYYPKVEHTGESDWEAHSKERTGVVGTNYLARVKELPNTDSIEIDFDDNMPDVYRSDLLRLKLLAEQGGLWLDMDVITFRPMNEAVFNSGRYDTILSYSLKRNHYSIGYMLASSNNKFFNFLYSQGIKNETKAKWLLDKYGDRQLYGVILWDNYFNHINSISKRFPFLNLYNFEFTTCYPYLYNDMDNILVNNAPLPEDAIAIHFYGGHPDVRYWENTLTADNYKEYNTTLTNCIKRGLNEKN